MQLLVSDLLFDLSHRPIRVSGLFDFYRRQSLCYFRLSRWTLARLPSDLWPPSAPTKAGTFNPKPWLLRQPKHYRIASKARARRVLTTLLCTLRNGVFYFFGCPKVLEIEWKYLDREIDNAQPNRCSFKEVPLTSRIIRSILALNFQKNTLKFSGRSLTY